MDQKIVFNNSLPRAGSTLLQNILAQNPRYFCSATSGLINLLLAARASFSNHQNFKAQDPEQMRAAFLGFCAGGLRSFYRASTDKPICVDKARGWTHYYDWLAEFHPDPKILVCIRDLRAVVSSFEKLFRKNRYRLDPADNPEMVTMASVSMRINYWLNNNPIGVSILQLNDAVQTGIIKHCHVVRFEDLTANPKATMQKVYDYLEEPPFEHDFEHVEQKTHEDDMQYVFYGDHKIREAIRPVPLDYNEVLGKEYAERIKAAHPWFYATFYPEKSGTGRPAR